MERRLAAIMFADIVGYTALMAESEAKGLRARERHRAVVRPVVEKYHGEAIEARGDESLAVFPTALDAVNCALALQQQLAADGELRLHIGIHVGDFVLEHGEVSGDAVNIAARIRSFAETGVCVSGEVYHSVRNQPNVEATALGEHELKNVGRPVALFAVRGTAAAPSAAVTRRQAPGGLIRSIAVLPLENLSGDPTQDYFADGMTETLIGDLGNLRSLRVISRTSVMRYKGTRKPLPEIAAELGVDALLEGTVIRDGERVRITTQLIDGRTDHHLWSERYDRDLRGILELQSDVARAVARKIELELTPSEAARFADRPLVDPAAHEALLKGIVQTARYTPELIRSAIASFERAIELDPGYALACARLGLAWQILAADFDAVPHREGMQKAKSAAYRALELDESLADAHAVLGWTAFRFDWDWPAAMRHFQRAVELNPSLAIAHLFISYHLSSRGRYEEAIAAARRAVELSPHDLSLRTFLALQYSDACRYPEALELVQGVIEMDPAFRLAHFAAAVIYGFLARYEESISALERFGMRPDVSAVMREALSRDAQQGYWRALLWVVRSQPRARPIELARAHARFGERDEAFAELERAYSSRDALLAYLRQDHMFDPLRDDPRFADLVRRIGIPGPDD